jgi:Short C-terminal domain
MLLQMESFIQIESQSTRSDSRSTFVIFYVLLIVVLLIWRLMKYLDFSDAKQEFEMDPSNPENKQRLLETARANRDYGKSGVMALTLIEEQKDREKLKEAGKHNIVVELQALADLHAKGHLSDAEFEQAKAKLLN